MLIDQFGRTARDLRVSLTDRCNLRCLYCMPAEGVPWLPSDQQLSDDELLLAIDVAVSLGIERIRLTGGEPLIRPGIENFVERIAALNPRPEIALTTNGLGLAALADPLKRAGLDRINISLDTLSPERFAEMTRRNRFDDVMAGIKAAAAAGLTPVKINTVLMRGQNDHEAGALLRWSLQNGYRLRFIEQMPLDAQHAWNRDEMITADETIALLSKEFALTPMDGRGSAPAEEFMATSHDGAIEGRVGIIGSVTRPFCAACDRLRLTSDGQVRNCLFARQEESLRDILRNGSRSPSQTRDAIAEVLGLSIAQKKAGHGIGEPGFQQPDRPMSAIGG
jgi:GTP 3',8-cyclase